MLHKQLYFDLTVGLKGERTRQKSKAAFDPEPPKSKAAITFTHNCDCDSSPKACSRDFSEARPPKAPSEPGPLISTRFGEKATGRVTGTHTIGCVSAFPIGDHIPTDAQTRFNGPRATNQMYHSINGQKAQVFLPAALWLLKGCEAIKHSYSDVNSRTVV